MENIICCDIKEPPNELGIKHHITMNSVNQKAVDDVIEKYKINQIYSLSALLSATGEVDPLKTE